MFGPKTGKICCRMLRSKVDILKSLVKDAAMPNLHHCHQGTGAEKLQAESVVMHWCPRSRQESMLSELHLIGSTCLESKVKKMKWETWTEPCHPIHGIKYATHGFLHQNEQVPHLCFPFFLFSGFAPCHSFFASWKSRLAPKHQGDQPAESAVDLNRPGILHGFGGVKEVGNEE